MNITIEAFEDNSYTDLTNSAQSQGWGLSINLICTVILFYIVLRNKNMSTGQKTIWCVFSVLFGILTLLAWFIFGRRRYTAENSRNNNNQYYPPNPPNNNSPYPPYPGPGTTPTPPTGNPQQYNTTSGQGQNPPTPNSNNPYVTNNPYNDPSNSSEYRGSLSSPADQPEFPGKPTPMPPAAPDGAGNTQPKPEEDQQ